jgi:multiple sugar transport system permease protein
MLNTNDHPKKSSLNRQKWGRLPAGWWGLLPSVLSLLIFIGYPLVQVLGFSTLEWGGIAAGKFIGAGNYQNMLSDSDLRESLFTTLKFAAFTLPLYVLLSVFIALEIEGTRFERPVKALMFLPGLITVAASAVSWYTLFSDYGVFTALTGITWRWGSEPWAALFLIVAFTLWQHLGYGILVFSAGLKSIPSEVLEAARVDGASEGLIKRKIILPLLWPSLVFLGVVGSLYALQSYTAVFLLTKGSQQTRVLGYYLYKVAFEDYRFGYGAALSVFVLLLAFSIAALQGRFLSRGSTE